MLKENFNYINIINIIKYKILTFVTYNLILICITIQFV